MTAAWCWEALRRKEMNSIETEYIACLRVGCELGLLCNRHVLYAEGRGQSPVQEDKADNSDGVGLPK